MTSAPVSIGQSSIAPVQHWANPAYKDYRAISLQAAALCSQAHRGFTHPIVIPLAVKAPAPRQRHGADHLTGLSLGFGVV